MPDHYDLLPIAKPSLGEEEAAAAGRVIQTGWVTQGPEVALFEQEFAKYTGAPFACAVSNCTTALHLALLAVGVRPGDEVITASHSFIATANSIRYCGAIPVFVDIDADTFNIDPSLIAPAITKKTRAVLSVHQLGMPCDMAAILDVARTAGLAVVEDAACAIGSEICWKGEWQSIGRPVGDVACFSFHPRKVITTGDGGMLTTANPIWDEQFRLWRQHGMSVPDTVRHAASRIVFEQYETLGFNYRMTDIQAAVGRVQLAKLPGIIKRRRELADRYRRLLSELPGLAYPSEPAWARSNWQSYCVRLPVHCEQRAVMQALLDRRIATRRGVMCAHREPAYASYCDSLEPPYRASSLAESETAQDRSIVLPLFPAMTDADQDRVVAAFFDVCASPCNAAA